MKVTSERSITRTGGSSSSASAITASKAGAVLKSISPPMLTTATPPRCSTEVVMGSRADTAILHLESCRSWRIRCRPSPPSKFAEILLQRPSPRGSVSLGRGAQARCKVPGGSMSDQTMELSGTGVVNQTPTISSEGLLPQLVQHLRQNRTALREEWARRITEAELLTAMSPEEIFSEATTVYDSYVEVLETGSVEALQDYARDLSERIIPRGVETNEVVGIVLLLRDVLARSLFEKYQTDFDLLNRVLDAYEPAANRIANTVAVGFVQERERIIRQQQEAIRELSTPVLQVREQLLI